MALLGVGALLVAAVAAAAAADGGYSVPEPYIQALRPKGVRFSIPDEPGVELFAVHANVNKELRDLEAGELSRDVLRARGGRWVLEDTQLRLRPGDRLQYWLYVKRDGLGYRRDGGHFTVTELVDRGAAASPPLASAQHCPQGCLPEGAPSDPLTAQRLRHADELHQQRLRHADELHRERLRQLHQRNAAPADADATDASASDPGVDVQDVSAFKRIGSRR